MITALETIEIDWKSLFDQMSLGFALHRLVWDENGEAKDIVYLEVNPIYQKLTGLSRETVLNKGVNETMPGLERAWFERYAKVVKTGESVTFEQEAKPLGRIYKVYAFKAGPNEFATVFADITEEKKEEVTLATEKELINTLINSMDDFIASKSIGGKYLECNDAFAKLFVGRPKEEIIGKTDVEIFGEKDKAKLMFVLEKDKDVFENGTAIREEWEAVLADGRAVNLETIKTPFKDISGKLAGLVAVTRDITKRKSVENELKERAESLEMLNKMMVARELKMVDLKKQIETLQKNGQ